MQMSTGTWIFGNVDTRISNSLVFSGTAEEGLFFSPHKRNNDYT